MRQAGDGAFRELMIVAIVISSNMSQSHVLLPMVSPRPLLSLDHTGAPGAAAPSHRGACRSGQAARVLAGLSSMAQVQGCVMGPSGGTREQSDKWLVRSAWRSGMPDGE